jgi:flagellar motor protein MotB
MKAATVDFMNRMMLFALGMTLAAAASAQQYKWTDSSGRVQYGDVPPPGVSVTRLKRSTGGYATPSDAPAADAKDAAKAAAKGPLTPAEQEAAYRRRQQDAAKDRDKQAAADQQAAAKRQNCASAQENLRALESGQRIMRTDAKGERVYLEDAQIQQEAARARAVVQQACN